MDNSKFREMNITNGAIACPTDELQKFVCCLIYSTKEGRIDHAVGCKEPPTATHMLEILGFMGDKYPATYDMIVFLLPRAQMMKTSTVYEINNTTGQAKVMIDATATPQQQVEGVMKMVQDEYINFNVGAQMVADIFMNAGLQLIGDVGCNDPECFHCQLITAAINLIPIEKRPKVVSVDDLNKLTNQRAEDIDMRMVGSMGSFKGTTH